jgi:hypothetical protein
LGRVSINILFKAKEPDEWTGTQEWETGAQTED